MRGKVVDDGTHTTTAQVCAKALGEGVKGGGQGMREARRRREKGNHH